MHILKFIPMLLIIASCSHDRGPLSEQTLRSRIVDIESTQPYGSAGKWVILSTGHILTSRHVVERCARWWDMSLSWSTGFLCRVLLNGQKYPIHEIHFPDPSRDIALLEADLEQYYPLIPELSELELTAWESVFILTATGRISGSIIGLAQDYIGYDATLSWRTLSGTVVTDIVVDRGESGTPIWTTAGEFIGVMSAVDRVGKRSYGVR